LKVISEELSNSDENNFCPAPFASLQVNAFGNFGVCAKSAGSFYHKQSATLQDKWLSKEMKDIRSNFLANKKSKECFRCWEEEKVQVLSLRKQYLENFNLEENLSEGMRYVNSKEYEKGPRVLVIQSSNYCNFSCRTCHAVDSSGFNREGEYYANEYNEKNNRYRATGYSQENIEIDNKHFSENEFKQYIEMCGNLRRIDFYGGEPILNNSHHVLLQDLVNNQKSQEIELVYCTNGSTVPSLNLLTLWKNFKKIIITFSIDSSGDGYHYIRYPGTWSKLKDNIEVYKQLSEKGINIKLISNVTVSLLNIYYLKEIVCSISNLFNGDLPSLNLALNPSYYSIKNLPNEFKKIILDRLSAGPFNAYFKGVTSYISSENSEPDEFEKFIIWTKRKDLYRNQDFRKYFPEYYELIANYFDRYSSSENLKKIIADGKY
jgi:hypothetical protein